MGWRGARDGRGEEEGRDGKERGRGGVRGRRGGGGEEGTRRRGVRKAEMVSWEGRVARGRLGVRRRRRGCPPGVGRGWWDGLGGNVLGGCGHSPRPGSCNQGLRFRTLRVAVAASHQYDSSSSTSGSGTVYSASQSKRRTGRLYL